MYTGPDGTNRYTYDFQWSHPELMSWLKPLSKCVGSHIAIGPHRTFYACVPCDTAGGILYSPTIPATLKTLLDSSSSVPHRRFTAHVCLGFGGAWFVIWPNGDVAYDLAGQFTGLEIVLKKLPERCITYLALNPYAPEHYFLVTEDGTVIFSLPEEWAAGIEMDIVAWQNRYRNIRRSTIWGGKADSETTLGGGGMVIPVRGQVKKEKDLPPPYEGKNK
ncbi:hypothetical protein BCR34DRAFT_34738 [Clohesyomyces aquaticus]|uniref:Uncharacterized protein n=1 Tax=Clohesyomyces aquaticus TaxID=1231657 RepID=A0A1Y1Z8P8_9PLEO|nr:hypothetical protein BCR34DRAFT_34738 [Clohesyomyces aquaticus]